MPLAGIAQREIGPLEMQRPRGLAVVEPLELAVRNRQPVLLKQPIQEFLALPRLGGADRVEPGDPEAPVGEALERERGMRELEGMDLHAAP